MYQPIGHKVEKMFSGIALKYDFLNHLLSFGLDFLWRKALVNKVKKIKPRTVLDLATGSGDVAFSLRKSLDYSIPILAQDFCEPMLEQARIKQRSFPQKGPLKFEFGDCMDLTLEDTSFDAITISFGVRNFENRVQGFREMHRVLDNDGSLFILEFSQPYQWFKPIYFIYLKYILPTIAGLITKDKEAYKYLAGTIESFPTKESLSEQLREAGFQKISTKSLTFSTVVIHQASKH